MSTETRSNFMGLDIRPQSEFFSMLKSMTPAELMVSLESLGGALDSIKGLSQEKIDYFRTQKVTNVISSANFQSLGVDGMRRALKNKLLEKLQTDA